MRDGFTGETYELVWWAQWKLEQICSDVEETSLHLSAVAGPGINVFFISSSQQQ